MGNFFAPIGQISTGTNSGSSFVGLAQFSPASFHCDDVQTALNDAQAPVSYPVACDFVNLSSTGIVWFENPDTFGLDGLEVIAESQFGTGTFTLQQLEDVYSIETGFIVVAVLLWSLMRQLRKIRNFVT